MSILEFISSSFWVCRIGGVFARGDTAQAAQQECERLVKLIEELDTNSF